VRKRVRWHDQVPVVAVSVLVLLAGTAGCGDSSREEGVIAGTSAARGPGFLNRVLPASTVEAGARAATDPRFEVTGRIESLARGFDCAVWDAKKRVLGE
jgi:hypothetical protein